MKKITFLGLPVIAIFLIGSFYQLHAQDLMRKIPLQALVANADQVVEGKVISKESFWDENYNNIYTINTVRVYKVFKGEVSATIEVVTLGGVVGLQAEVVSPSLRLNKNDIGMFILKHSTIDLNYIDNLESFESYGVYQGFLKYNFANDLAASPALKREGISTSLYNEVMGYTKSSYIVVSDLEQSLTGKINVQKSLFAPSAIAFSPSTITAGTGSELTITGSGFGATAGSVGFSNADDGGATFVNALNSQIISWSDTEIRVEVPSIAGTGPIRVTDSSNDFADSASSLTVSYSEINIDSDAISAGTFVAYPTQHSDDDGSGGYTWQMFTDFDSDADSKAAFLRAFEHWRCESLVNWTLGSTTTIDVIAGDGVNVIRYDNGLELPSSTLGRCTSRFSGCLGGGGVDWFVTELDIVFNDDFTWHTGIGAPSSGTVDFESVALHELGHGHQLSHVIDDSDDVMHWVLSPEETQRTLNTNNITAANNVHGRSTGSAVCAQPLMTNYAGSCALSLEEMELRENVILYPNPASTKLFIDNNSYLSLRSATIFDASGRLILDFNIMGSNRNENLDISAISSGVYFIKIASDSASISKKLVIK